jgi:hypothetical protein
MSTTLKNTRFVRQVLQGRTAEPVACTAMPAAVQQAYDAMRMQVWTRVGAKTATLPRHNWAQSGFQATFDAATYCGDYAEGYQHAYACAVCYTFRVPATALDGTPAGIESIAIPALGDRWLKDGCSIGVWISASVTPPTWGAVLAGTDRNDVVTAQMAVTPSNTGTDSSAIITFDWSGAPKTALAYVHIVVYMTSYLTHRGAWIEGGAMIDGENIAWQYNENGMTADAREGFDELVLVTARHNITPTDGNPDNWRGAYPSSGVFTFGSASAALQEYQMSVDNFYAKILDPAAESLTKGAYVKRIDATTDYAVCVASSFNYQFTSYLKTYTHVYLKLLSTFAPTTGVNVRLVLYAVADAFEATNNRWCSIPGSAAATIPTAIVRGTATSISFVFNGPVYANKNVTCIMNTVLVGGTTYAAGTKYPLLADWTPNGPTTLLLVMSVDEVTASPGTTIGAEYGITYATPEDRIYFALK